MLIAEVELDSRQRVPLAKLLRMSAPSQRYRVELREDGTILMTPLLSMTEEELAAVANPEVVAGIKRGIADSRAGRVTAYEPGHFAKKLAAQGIDPEEIDEEEE